ncbi:MAG: metallophosphoesterase [Lactobacillaceae bacterium]|jgi:predicted MPP superfamily phosphohydrolase|nr:metallophosphoesterase [Lactobacillaceae bacterium]
MLFIVFATIVAISCSAITIRTLVGYSDFSILVKAVVTIVVAFSWFAPVISMTLKRNFHNVSGIVTASQILYMLFGLAFILFTTLLVRDFVWYILYYSKKFNIPSPKDVSWINKTNLYALIFSLLVFSYSLYEGMKDAPVKEVDLYSSKINGSFSIALVTDIHIDQDTNDKKIERLVERVNSLNPDIILFVGDMVDATINVLESKVDILKGLKAKYGVLFTSGNHEMYNGLPQWMIKFSSMGEGFSFVDNLGISFNDKNVFIFGLPDARVLSAFPMFTPDLDKVMEDVSEDSYKILMSHAPHIVDGLPEGMFDLQLSGHTHGGQIFPFHILAKMENKYLAGLYDVNGTKLYVSRGAGHWGPPLRFLAPSEITFIKVMHDEEKQ